MTLPELPPENHARPELWFRLDEIQLLPSNVLWLHHWLSPTGQPALSYGRENSCNWLRFAGSIVFRIAAAASDISCLAPLETTNETIRHLLLDQVLPRCMAHQGKFMLHASAVWFNEGLLLLTGDSGVGKSTLAGDFHRARQSMVSDDCLWVKENGEKIVAVPAYRGLRLWEDSLEVLFGEGTKTRAMADYSTKRRVFIPGSEIRTAHASLPVLALIVLSAGCPSGESEVMLEPLSRREAFIALHKQSFQLDPTDLDRMARHMRVLGRIVPRLKVFRLSLPHDYALLPAVRERILEAVL